MCALIPAAGRGARFESTENKVFAPLLGRPLLGWTLQAFTDCEAIDFVVLIGAADERDRLAAIGAAFGGGKLGAVVTGGATRQESVRLGLAAVPVHSTLVAVHDAARCCLTPEILARTIRQAQESGAATAAIAITDTLFRAETAATIDREGLYAIQTPQVFEKNRLVRAHAQAVRDGFHGTDDAALVRRLADVAGASRVALVDGAPANIKVTRPDDLPLAEAILRQRHGLEMGMRIGHGYDVHALVEGRPLWLGGVHFQESPVGLDGHSDADALLHAVCDALLGAAGLGDIGKLFPPSDPRHRNRRSVEFLQEVKAHLDRAAWRVGNVDITVLAERPRIGPRADQMRQVIGDALGIAPEQVSVKATTNEKLGFVGRGEGIAVHATALLFR